MSIITSGINCRLPKDIETHEPIQDPREGENNLKIDEPLSYDLPDKDVGAAGADQLGSESPRPSSQVEDPTVNDDQ
jgi:hypothetical protein